MFFSSKKGRNRFLLITGLVCSLTAFGLCGCGGNGTGNDAAQDAGQSGPVDGGTTNLTDPKAPKEIESKDIEEFYAAFCSATRWSGVEEHNFEFKIKKNDSGELTASESFSGISAPADENLLNALQEVIDETELVKLNGVYETTEGLSPEYQARKVEVKYASGEVLTFTRDNDPYAEWAEKIYDVFADWFAAQGETAIYPEPETSAVTDFRINFCDKGVWTCYGGTETGETSAAGGEPYVLEENIFSAETLDDIAMAIALFPEDYYDKIAEILNKYDVVRKYEFSVWNRETDDESNHEAGYFGWGGDVRDREEDTEDHVVEIDISYESGRKITIDSRKVTEIENMRPMIEELIAYHQYLFETPVFRVDMPK